MSDRIVVESQLYQAMGIDPARGQLVEVEQHLAPRKVIDGDQAGKEHLKVQLTTGLGMEAVVIDLTTQGPADSPVDRHRILHSLSPDRLVRRGLALVLQDDRLELGAHPKRHGVGDAARRNQPKCMPAQCSPRGDLHLHSDLVGQLLLRKIVHFPDLAIGRDDLFHTGLKRLAIGPDGIGVGQRLPVDGHLDSRTAMPPDRKAVQSLRLSGQVNLLLSR